MNECLWTSTAEPVPWCKNIFWETTSLVLEAESASPTTPTPQSLAQCLVSSGHLIRIWWLKVKFIYLLAWKWWKALNKVHPSSWLPVLSILYSVAVIWSRTESWCRANWNPSTQLQCPPCRRGRLQLKSKWLCSKISPCGGWARMEDLLKTDIQF